MRAFIAAKIGDTLHILLETKPMSRSEITAKQLAHNSIAGNDDPGILKKMYLSIEEAHLRMMAFIDEKKLELPELTNIQIKASTPVLTCSTSNYYSFPTSSKTLKPS